MTADSEDSDSHSQQIKNNIEETKNEEHEEETVTFKDLVSSSSSFLRIFLVYVLPIYFYLMLEH